MLVVINGPAAVGKSTVAGLVASRLPRSVHVSGDSLRSFAPPAAPTFLGAGCTDRTAACLATSYLEMGADAVVDRLGAGGFPFSSATSGTR